MHTRVKVALENAKVPYSERVHAELRVPIRSPIDFAEALGYVLERITKTLLLRAADRAVFCLAVLASNERVDLTRVAPFLNAKRVQLASRAELAEELGYPPTGVSPLGALEIPVVMDSGLFVFPTILVGSGEAGSEVELCPKDVRDITNATVVDLRDGGQAAAQR